MLDRITKTTKKGPWKVAKNMWKHVPLTAWNPGERVQEKVTLKTLILNIPFFKTTVFQIEATGNFKNLKRMQKISAINTVIYYNLQLFQNYMEL